MKKNKPNNIVYIGEKQYDIIYMTWMYINMMLAKFDPMQSTKCNFLYYYVITIIMFVYILFKAIIIILMNITKLYMLIYHLILALWKEL